MAVDRYPDKRCIGLSPEQLERYKADGVLFPLPLLSPDELDEIRRHYASLERALGGRPSALELTQLHLSFRWAWNLAVHPRALDLVQALIGPDIAVWATSVFCKFAEDDAYVGWHQDCRFWAMSGDDVVSLWVALTPSLADRGAMRVLRGTHRGPVLEHAVDTSPKNVLSRAQEICRLPLDAQVIDVELAPGECSIHHVRAVHGSAGNMSTHPRIGFVTRYLPPWTRQPLPMQLALARGSADAFAEQVLVGPPDDDDLSPSGIARFRVRGGQFLTGVRQATAEQVTDLGALAAEVPDCFPHPQSEPD